MKYQFSLKTTASDLWQLLMYGIYGSMLGMVNVVFTLAMVFVAFRFYADAPIALKLLMIAGIGLFTVIQPALLYARASAQAAQLPGEVALAIGAQGVHIRTGDKTSELAWPEVRGILRKPTMLVLFSSARHGFVLTNKITGDQKEEVYRYIKSRIAA